MARVLLGLGWALLDLGHGRAYKRSEQLLLVVLVPPHEQGGGRNSGGGRRQLANGEARRRTWNGRRRPGSARSGDVGVAGASRAATGQSCGRERERKLMRVREQRGIEGGTAALMTWGGSRWQGRRTRRARGRLIRGGRRQRLRRAGGKDRMVWPGSRGSSPRSN